MQKWTVANQKGGVGKTTTVITLAGLLAEAGQRVLMVDMDPQASLTQYLGQNCELPHLFGLFRDRQDLNAERVRQTLITLPWVGMSLLAASPLLATVEKLGAQQGGMGMGKVLGDILQMLENDFDRVLIDTSPTLGVLLVNALACADRLILPVQTEFLALKGLERMLRTLGMVMRSQQRDLPYMILPTLYDKRTLASQQCLQQLRQTYGEAVASVVIGIDTRFRDASQAGVPPSLFGSHSRGVQAYREWLQQQGELP